MEEKQELKPKEKIEKQWYHCWMKHNWGKWSEPERAGITYIRQCRVCLVYGLAQERIE